MFGTYASILRRRLLLMVWVGIPVAALAFVAMSGADDVYRSEAVIRVGTQNISDVVLGRVGSYSEPDRRVANELEVIASPAVLDAAADLVRAGGADLDGADLARRTSFEQRAFSDAISVAAEAGDPAVAQLVAASVVEAYLEHRRAYQRDDLEGIRDDLLERAAALQAEITGLDQEIAADPDSPAATAARSAAVLRYQEVAASLETVSLPLASELSGVEVVSPAGLPEEPEPTADGRATILAILAGALVAGAVALLVEVLRNPVRTSSEAELVAASAPVLATLPRPRRGMEGWLDELREGGAAESASRALRFTVDAVFAGSSFPRSILVTSAAGDDEQALYAATALAASCGTAGLRTLLVADVDQRTDALRLPGAALDRRGPSDARAESTRLPSVGWRPATSTPHHQGVLVSAPTLPAALRALDGPYDLVVLVSPPAAEMAEIVAIARSVEVVVVACALGRTRGKRLEQLVGMLQRGGVVVTGLAVTTEWRGHVRRRAAKAAPEELRTPAPAGR